MTKIMIATTNGGLDDEVCSTFGRAPTFTMVDIEGSDIVSTSILSNEHADAAGGAGIQAAQWVIDSGAQAVIAGNYGPKAGDVFARSEIQVLSSQNIRVSDAVQLYVEGKLTEVTLENTEAQGYGSGSAGGGMGRGGGQGMGRGGGGKGRSRGIGQGCGGGMGRGRGGRQ